MIGGADVATAESVNSFGARDELKVGDAAYTIYRLDAVEGSGTLPYSLKVLLENLLRTEDGANRRMGRDGRARHRDPVHSRPGDHAGLHRCAMCCRSGHDA